MIKTKVTYLKKKFFVMEEEPSTVQELVTLVGEEGLVTNTVANLRYRNKYPRVYKRVSLEVVKLGFPMTEEYKDEVAHLSAYLTANPMHEAILDKLFQQIALEEPLFIRGDRSGGGKVAQGALDAAHKYFAEGHEKVEEVVMTIEQMLPSFKVNRTGEPTTPEMLARGIQTLQRHLVSKAKAVSNNL